MRYPDRETAEPTEADTRPSRDRRPRVLVIDDQRLMRWFLRQLLTRAGFQVIEAAGGTEGIRQLREVPVDLVLTDLRMPDCSGWEVARAARQLCPKLPVVLVTGSADAEAAAPDLRALVDVIVLKPVCEEIFMPLLGALLARSRPEAHDRPVRRDGEVC